MAIWTSAACSILQSFYKWLHLISLSQHPVPTNLQTEKKASAKTCPKCKPYSNCLHKNICTTQDFSNTFWEKNSSVYNPSVALGDMTDKSWVNDEVILKRKSPSHHSIRIFSFWWGWMWAHRRWYRALMGIFACLAVFHDEDRVRVCIWRLKQKKINQKNQ